MSYPTFDDLAAVVANDPGMSAASSRASLADIQASDRYDLDTLLDADGDYELIARLRDENTDGDGFLNVEFSDLPRNLLIRWLRGNVTGFASFKSVDGAVYGWLYSDGVWISGREFGAETWEALKQNVVNALLLVAEAEANHEDNVEFVDREVMAPAGTPVRQRFASKRVRTISLTQTRKQYLGGSTPHQGGTHARPCEHVRVLTERVIQPKNRKPYLRKAKVITINAGVRRETRVVL